MEEGIIQFIDNIEEAKYRQIDITNTFSQTSNLSKFKNLQQPLKDLAMQPPPKNHQLKIDQVDDDMELALRLSLEEH